MAQVLILPFIQGLSGRQFGVGEVLFVGSIRFDGPSYQFEIVVSYKARPEKFCLMCLGGREGVGVAFLSERLSPLSETFLIFSNNLYSNRI